MQKALSVLTLCILSIPLFRFWFSSITKFKNIHKNIYSQTISNSYLFFGITFISYKYILDIYISYSLGVRFFHYLNILTQTIHHVPVCVNKLHVSLLISIVGNAFRAFRIWLLFMLCYDYYLIDLQDPSQKETVQAVSSTCTFLSKQVSYLKCVWKQYVQSSTHAVYKCLDFQLKRVHQSVRIYYK